MDGVNEIEDIQVSVTIDDCDIVKGDDDSDSDTAVSSSCWRFEYFTEKGSLMRRMEVGSSGYEISKWCFQKDMRNFVKDIHVVGVYRKKRLKDLDLMARARVEAFSNFSAAASTKNGGDGNIKLAWYGASREEIRDICLYGFRPSRPLMYDHGVGVYLSPSKLPMESVLKSVADEDGVRHLLSCHVILGKSEEIPFGSQMNQPSSVEFDSGVDNLLSPRKYIIWEPYMNTHILPFSIVSFKIGSSTGLSKVPDSPPDNIKNIVGLLNTHVIPKRALIAKTVLDFKRNKITSSQFMRSYETIVGDDACRALIEAYKR